MEILEKALRAYHQGRFLSAIALRMKPFLYGLKHTIYAPVSKQVALHCPDYVNPSKDDDEISIVERIFQSFRKMKEDQKAVSDLYRPSSLWQGQLDDSYSYLTEGLKLNDLEKFHFFLSNFGAWEKYHGVESTTLIRNNMKSLIRRNYLKSVIFLQQLNVWQNFYNNRKPISCLSHPPHGNQVGAYINGAFVGVDSFFMEIYGSLLSELVSDTSRPVVAELGAGYGKLAFFTLRNLGDSCFIDFDLPETLCLAAYYLMKTWPNKKTLLYGEGEYSEKAHDQYDLIFMPSWEISKTGKNSIDLFMNQTSLGEMTKEAVTNYVDHIVGSTKFFFHMNHDVYPNIYVDGERGLLGHEYPVPKGKFKLLFRYPDIGHMLFHGGIDYSMDIVLYLYVRR
jgi:putative sugar O-methyltransferase